MIAYIYIVICIVASYLIGGFNTGYYLVKYYSGNDLRTEYSGTVGATNAGRVMGKKGFALTFLGDFIKGVLVLEAARFLHFDNTVLLLLIPACVLGHIFPIQLGFRGGKGMSTVGGAVLGYYPLLFAISFPLFLTLIFITKSKLYGGLAGLFCLSFIAFVLNRDITEFSVLFATSLIIILKHRQDLILSFKKPINGE